MMADVEFDNPTYDPEGDDPPDDLANSFQPEDQETWGVPKSLPSWAQADIPAGISSDDLVTQEQIEALKDRWLRERGLIGGNLEFASTNRGELWLRWGGTDGSF